MQKNLLRHPIIKALTATLFLNLLINFLITISAAFVAVCFQTTQPDPIMPKFLFPLQHYCYYNYPLSDLIAQHLILVLIPISVFYHTFNPSAIKNKLNPLVTLILLVLFTLATLFIYSLFKSFTQPTPATLLPFLSQ